MGKSSIRANMEWLESSRKTRLIYGEYQLHLGQNRNKRIINVRTDYTERYDMLNEGIQYSIEGLPTESVSYKIERQI